MPTKIADGTQDYYAADTTVQSVCRDANENIYAFVAEDINNVRPYVSTDGGSTWIQGSQLVPHFCGGNEAMGVVIDSTGTFHACAFYSPTFDTQYKHYHRFNVSTSGTVTFEVKSELVASLAGNHFTITLDANDIPWMLTAYTNKVMGTDYRNLELQNRSGGSWSSVGNAFTGSDYMDYSVVEADGTGDIHALAFGTRNDRSFYNRYDVSAGALTGQEVIADTGSVAKGDLVINTSNEPIVANRDNGTLYKKTGGSWISQSLAGGADVDASMAIRPDDELFVVYSSGGDIHLIRGTWSSYDPSSSELLVSSAETESLPSLRWKWYNDNPPADQTMDMLYAVTSTSPYQFWYHGFASEGGVEPTAGSVIVTSNGVMQTSNGVLRTQ